MRQALPPDEYEGSMSHRSSNRPPITRRGVLGVVPALAAMATLPGCGGGGGGGVPPGPVGPPPAPGVDGPAWWGFGRDAQHSAISAIASQDLNRIAWSTPVDLAPQYQASGSLLIHYGSPVVTTRNTVIVPVKTEAAGGCRFEARSGGNGGLIWFADSDYILPAHNWVPSYNLALTTGNRLYAPGAGGKLFVRDNADSATGPLLRAVFFGERAYAEAAATYDATVFINTPLTVDSSGNVFFGFIVTAPNPAGLISGIARIGADGVGSWAPAAALANDLTISKLAMNCAPAVSPDGRTLYVVVNTARLVNQVQSGYLVALDASTLAVRARVPLRDPGSAGGSAPARISDNSTASPTVGPDGKVYIGVLENLSGSHNGRGWLLQFNAVLGSGGVPGGFGWDDTASVVPASMVASYNGASPYLLMVKYNNYRGAGTGDGVNQLAVIDPNVLQSDPISGLPIMREVLTIAGPTFEAGSNVAVKEWCINTAAVDPATNSVLANSEDGYLYRWNLTTNTFTQRIQLTSGIAESYTPTAIGADGSVYAVNNAELFSIAA
jgi:hypothetical protein